MDRTKEVNMQYIQAAGDFLAPTLVGLSVLTVVVCLIWALAEVVIAMNLVYDRRVLLHQGAYVLAVGLIGFALAMSIRFIPLGLALSSIALGVIAAVILMVVLSYRERKKIERLLQREQSGPTKTGRAGGEGE